MYYGKINAADIANGVGVRASLFVSGCPHHCPGCFNPQTWDFKYGKPFSFWAMAELDKALSRPNIRGLSILGGEPLAPENEENVLSICYLVKSVYPYKDIWTFGFTPGIHGRNCRNAERFSWTGYTVSLIFWLMEGL